MDATEKQFRDAAVYADHVVGDEKAPRLRGYYVIGLDGQLVIAPPGALRLAASNDRGVYVDGLKPGWKLGSEADAKRKKAEGEALDKARAAAEKQPAAKQ